MSIAERTDLREPEPAWDVAKLFPAQGYWSEFEFLELTESTNRIVEFTNGHIEVLPVPTMLHQRILLYLLDALREFALPRKLGEALPAALRVRVGKDKFRGPDIVFMKTENASRKGNEYWDGADLVVEIVSPDFKSRERDYERKRQDYAEANIAEYWIVDPQEEKITVLGLDGDRYGVHGEFQTRGEAASALLEGFRVDVAAVFAAGKQP